MGLRMSASTAREMSPGSSSCRAPWLEVLAAALPAALHAVLLLGRLHPDEVFQSLEPALSRAFGFGVQAWEWQVGLRNHAIPVLFSWLLRAASAGGVDDVWWRRVVLEVPQYALHVAMLGAVWRLSARRVGASLARWCLWLVALYGPLVWFGGRTMSEAISTALLVWGLERLDDPDARATAWGFGGALLGLSVVARYGSAAVVAPAMLWLLASRRVGALFAAGAGGLVVAGLLGLLDRLTWGAWFHSFITYVDFNVLSGQAAARFGAQPFWFYVPRLALAPWAALGLLLWTVERRGRAWLLFVAGLGYFVSITGTAHKEERFLYPTLVLWTVAGTPAFVAFVAERWSRPWVKGLLAAALLGGAAFFVVPSPWEPQRKEQFQLEVEASRTATGFVLMNDGLWGSGGYFYLGRPIPWCACDVPSDACFQTAVRDRRFNRGVYWSSNDEARDRASRAAFEAAGFRVTRVRGLALLFERD